MQATIQRLGGSANGINKSIDGGMSWRQIFHQNQSHPISGRLRVASEWTAMEKISGLCGRQLSMAVDLDEGERCKLLADGGATWKTALLGDGLITSRFKTLWSMLLPITDYSGQSDFGEAGYEVALFMIRRIFNGLYHPYATSQVFTENYMVRWRGRYCVYNRFTFQQFGLYGIFSELLSRLAMTSVHIVS